MDMENREEVAETARKALAERQEQIKKDAESLEARLATPIGEAEARRAYAEIGMREARLLLAREQVVSHLNEVDQQLAACRCARAEIECRLTVVSVEKESE